MQLRPHRPLVSIVVIFKDEERFLSEAVESVIDQTYTEWELILVDDGSRDGSTEIARQYARSAPGRIRYLEHPGHANRGLSPSRNVGLRDARGELIALLDADDRWIAGKLQEQVSIFADYPTVGMVYGATEYWYGWTGKPEDSARDLVWSPGVEPESVLHPPHLLELMIPRIVPSPGPSGVVVRREAAESVGYFEEAFTGLYDDQVFIAKMSLAADVYASGRCWHRYRQHASSFYARESRARSRRDARMKYLEWLARYLDRAGYGAAPIRALVDEELAKLRLPLSQRLAGRVSRLAPGPAAAARRITDGVLAPSLRERAASVIRGRSYLPSAGRVQLGDLRRLTPISRKAGLDRGGRSMDRFYIERFLDLSGSDLQGRVLEVGNGYPSHSAPESHPHAPLCPKPSVVRVPTEELFSLPEHLDGSYDCVLLTHLQCVADPWSTLDRVARLLRPDGVVLAVLPGISPARRSGPATVQEFWRFTPRSARALFAGFFRGGEPRISSHGNVLTATAALHGIASDELSAVELAYDDPEYPVVITVRAARGAVGSGSAEEGLVSEVLAVPDELILAPEPPAGR